MSKNKGLSSRAIIGLFYQRLQVATGSSWIEPLSMYFLSDQESETYKWLGMAPAMREWVGGRHAKGFRENGITIENLPFEATLEVPVKWLQRDKTGQLMVRINEMADRSVTHWATLMSELILNGESQVCYDGQYYFDTDHEEGESGVQSNLISVDISSVPGAGADDNPARPSAKQAQEVVLSAAQQILGFVDDQGEPMNELAREFEVMVPTSLWKSYAAGISNPLIGSGETNVITQMDGFTFNLRQNARLKPWTDKIAVFRADGSAAPLIRQEEEPMSMKVVGEGSELEFNERKHQYGIEADRNVGYGLWSQACLAQAV